MCKYQNVVGIGYNCEISFRLQNYFGKIDAQLFSWAYIYDRERFLDAFEHPEKIYSGDMILKENGMFECSITGVRFHPRHEVLEDTSREESERIQWCKDELKQRVGHLIEKHRRLLYGMEKTLFLLKIKPESQEKDIAFIKRMYALLSKLYHSGKFMLVVVVPGKRYEKQLKFLERDKLRIRSLRWFPPQKHTDIASDSRGWANILSEFFGNKKKLFYKRERQQRSKIIPGMIKHKIKKFFR